MARLDNLPIEILLEILSYNTVAHNRCPAPIHPLNAIASTNKHLYAIVEEYTRGQLKQHANFTPPKYSKTFSCRRKWLAETCQFCKRKSQRRAILHPGLTCCRLCDKQYYPKMTMTQAIKLHLLSKLDLFTPNALHPNLPPLTTGLYTVMGSSATMLLESDVLNRKAHIRSLLGLKPEDPKESVEDMHRRLAAEALHRRLAAHDRLIAHMGIYYCFKDGWRRTPGLNATAMENLKVAKSMKTEEGRREYVKKVLEREWEAMGMGTGRSKDEPLKLE